MARNQTSPHVEEISKSEHHGLTGEHPTGAEDPNQRVPDQEKNNFRPGMDEAIFRTGRHYALDLAKRYSGTDWIAGLMELSGRRRDETEWHLQEDMVPPDDIKQACEKMLSSAG